MPENIRLTKRHGALFAIAAAAILIATIFMGRGWLDHKVLAAAPVAAFSFNETSGTTAANLGNPSVNGVVSGATWTTAGKNGGALSFDGVNDTVSVADYAALDLTSGMTLSAWVKPSSLSNWSTIMLKERSNGLAYALYAADGGNRPPSLYGRINADRSVVSNSLLPLSTWTHVTGTYDGANMRLYINGALVATRAQTGSMTTSNNPLMVGGNSIWGEYFKGSLDDLRVYSVALSAAEVTNDMNTPVQSTEPDTIKPSVPTGLSGSAVSGSQINLSWSASTDNVGVTGYQIIRNGVQIATSSTTTFGDATVNSGNSYTYVVKAYDAAGNVSDPSNEIIVTTPAPDTTQPVISAISSSVTHNSATISWTTDELSDSQVEYGTTSAYGSSTTLDGSLVTSHSQNLSGLIASTTYHFRVKSKDSAGNMSVSSNLTFTTQAPPADTTPPTVSITSPADGNTVSSIVTVSANANDNVGVSGVQFKLDGSNLGAEDTSSPYSISWNTTTAANGSHKLTAVVRDAAGNATTSATVTVNVSNSAGSGTALTIDGNQKFQTMDGFGVSANSASWNNGELIPALDKLVDENGSKIWRVIIEKADWEGTNDNSDPNTFNWTYYNSVYSSPRFEEFWKTVEYLNSKGISDDLYIATMGRGPAWLDKPDGGISTLAEEDEWAEMIASWVYYARNTRGIQFKSVSPNNEGDLGGVEGIRLSEDQQARMFNKLAVKLDAIGLGDVKIIAPENAFVDGCLPNYITALFNYPTLMSKVEHIAVHNYNGTTGCTDSTIKNSAFSDRNFWVTEVGTFVDTMAMLDENPTAILMWDGYDSVYQHAIDAGRGTTAPNDAGDELPLLAYNSTTGVYTPRKQFYEYTQLFKYIPKGAIRISASESSTNVTAYAFHHPVSNRVTVVGQNLGSSDATFSGSLLNLPSVSSFEYYITDSFSNFQRGSDVAVTDGKFSVVAPGSGIFTLTTSAPADQTPPTAPANLTGSGSIGSASLAWDAATDNVGVTRYNVHRSTVAGFTPTASNRISQPTLTSYTDNTSAGTYYYKVTAEDSAGNVSLASNEISVTVQSDTEAPTVSVTKPAAGSSVSGTVELSADAFDNVAVVGVKFFIDGTQVGSEDTSAPYVVSWNSASVANGSHSVTAEARDASSNTTLSSAVSFTVSNIAPSSLIAAFSFNEGSGSVLGDSAGGDNNGTISGATWSTAGKFGNALNFDGSNDLVSIADASNLDLTSGMTLEAWVRPDSLNGWTTALLKENGSSLAYALYASDNTNQPPAGYVKIGSDISAGGTSALPLGVWSHIAVTYDGAVLRFYVNGNFVGSTNISGNIAVSSGGLKIGGNNVWGEYFDGLIDEIRVYNTARSQTEIQSDMNTAL